MLYVRHYLFEAKADLISRQDSILMPQRASRQHPSRLELPLKKRQPSHWSTLLKILLLYLLWQKDLLLQFNNWIVIAISNLSNCLWCITITNDAEIYKVFVWMFWARTLYLNRCEINRMRKKMLKWNYQLNISTSWNDPSIGRHLIIVGKNPSSNCTNSKKIQNTS